MKQLAAIFFLLWAAQISHGGVIFLPPPPDTRITEFHYDNVGADTNEFVEVRLANNWLTTFGNELSDVSLYFYNGADGASLGSRALDVFTVGDSDGFYTLYHLTLPSGGLTSIQNGPDGLALHIAGATSDNGPQEFLSYGGSFLATNGPFNGLSSSDIGIAESGATPTTGSLVLNNSGSWQAINTNTKGLFGIPEPFSAMLTLAGLGLLAACRRR